MIQVLVNKIPDLLPGHLPKKRMNKPTGRIRIRPKSLHQPRQYLFLPRQVNIRVANDQLRQGRTVPSQQLLLQHFFKDHSTKQPAH